MMSVLEFVHLTGGARELCGAVKAHFACFTAMLLRAEESNVFFFLVTFLHTNTT
jgi:hypothetical protein